MQGKVTLEDHFAIEATLGDSQPFGAHVWPELRHRLLDFQDQRLRLMDQSGVEIMITSLNAPAIQGIPDVKQAAEVARRANDVLAAEVAKRPDRFVGVAALPMQEAEIATKELERCINDLGFKGALHTGLEEGKTPDGLQFKIRWEGLDGSAIDCVAKPPLDATKPQTFLSLATKLGESMDSDHVATLSLVTQRWFVLPMTDPTDLPDVMGSVHRLMPWVGAVGILAAAGFVPAGLLFYWLFNNLWTFVPAQLYIKKFLQTIPDHPFQEGSSLNAAGINYNSLKAAAALKRLHEMETFAVPGS